MVSSLMRLFATTCVLLIIPSVLCSGSVSITSVLPNTGHACVTNCIYNQNYNSPTDIGSVLSCAKPYANDCYCNTASTAAALASSWLESCDASACSAGDAGDDLTSMFSIYASYCIHAGYTQPGATEYYNPTATTARPGSTPASPTSGSTTTTTQVTLATETVSNTGDSATTLPQVTVTVQTTSTILVGSNGSSISAPSNSGHNKIALGVGLGVGLFFALIVVGVGLWFCLRRPSPRTEEYQQPMPTSEAPERAITPVIAVGGAFPITRKAVPKSRTTELTGEGVRRELSARDIPPFPPPVSPSSPVFVSRVHEISGEGHLSELPGQSRSPPPGYSPTAES